MIRDLAIGFGAGVAVTVTGLYVYNRVTGTYVRNDSAQVNGKKKLKAKGSTKKATKKSVKKSPKRVKTPQHPNTASNG